MVAPAIAAAGISAGASLLGGALSSHSSRSAARRNEAAQREFAQQGIRWKVADAKAAGIHPLYALGASTHSFTPSHVGDTSMGSGLAAAGQDIGRAITATQTQEERERAEAQRQSERAEGSRSRRLSEMLLEEQVAAARQSNIRSAAETDLIREQLAQSISRRLGQGVGPAMPSGMGVVPAGIVKAKPSEQVSHDPQVPGREAYSGEGKPGMVPYRLGGKKYGFTLDVPSSEFGEGLEGGGPFAWGLGALGIGGHYLSKFRNWLDDQVPPPGYKRIFRDGRIVLVPK